MGVLQQTIALLLLHVLVHGGFLIVAREVEVALSADSSIVDENGPLEAMIQGPQIENEGTQVIADEPGAGKPLGTQKTASFQEGNTVEDVMTTLQRDLAAVDQMVKLQEKKLQVLREMRNIWLQEHEGKTLEEGDITNRRRVDIGDVIDRKLDAIVADTVAAETARDFATYFVETLTIGQVADMKMMKIRRTSPMELIAIAYKVGVVEFYTSTAELLLSVDTEKNGINFISLELQDDQPCLVVTYETPSIALYELFLVSKDSRETESGVDGKTEQPLLFTVSIGLEYQLTVSRHRRVDLSAKASAVAIVRASRQLVVAVAKADGIIDFLAFNGTSLRQILTQASISAMGTRRNMLAFSNGTNVAVSSLTRAQGSVFHSCPGSSAGVSSIAFDTIHPDIMYTGTQRGEILVYSVNAGLSAENQACKLLSRSMISESSRISPVLIATTKSYVIAAGVQDVTVFNVSRTQRNGISLSRMCRCNTQSVVATTECQQLAGMSSMTFSEGAMESHLAFISAGISGKRKLILFHSLLPDEREASAFQWTVFVYVGVAVAAVIGSQLFIKWQRRTNVNPWDSIKRRDSPYGKYDDFKDQAHTSEFTEEDFGRYDSLSDELRRKIAQQKRGSTRRAMDDDTDY